MINKRGKNKGARNHDQLSFKFQIFLFSLYLSVHEDTHLAIIESEHADVSTMMDMITSHNRIGEIFHPNASQSVTTYFIIFVRSLCVIGDV